MPFMANRILGLWGLRSVRHWTSKIGKSHQKHFCWLKPDLSSKTSPLSPSKTICSVNPLTSWSISSPAHVTRALTRSFAAMASPTWSKSSPCQSITGAIHAAASKATLGACFLDVLINRETDLTDLSLISSRTFEKHSPQSSMLMCCNGELSMRRPNSQCCGAKTFDSTTHQCCRDTVISKAVGCNMQYSKFLFSILSNLNAGEEYWTH